MLHSVKILERFGVVATDGEAGLVRDVYFSEEDWRIRYIVVDAGEWLLRKEVLVGLDAIHAMDWERGVMQLKLTRETLKACPALDAARPLSPQQETELGRHYGYSDDWNTTYFGETGFPGIVEQWPPALPDQPLEPVTQRMPAIDDMRHLRSAAEIIGYVIEARDDRFGHLEDFLFDQADWTIQALVIDPVNWWPGKHVVVATSYVEELNRGKSQLALRMTRDEVERSQQFDPLNPSQSALAKEQYAQRTPPERLW